MSDQKKSKTQLPGFLATVWRGWRPKIESAAEDLIEPIILWVCVAIVHSVQGTVLGFRWSPSFIHVLEKAEELTVEATIIVYLVLAAMRFSYGQIKRGLKGNP